MEVKKLAKLFYDIRAGSEDAFIELITKYRSYMVNVCFSILQDSTRAKDLVPKIISTLQKLILKMTKPECKVKTFLYAVCSNESRNEFRKRRDYSIGQCHFAVIEKNKSKLLNIYPSDLKVIHQRESEVISEMSYLSQRIHYLIRKYGFPHDWISVLLDIPIGTSRGCYHTLTHKLREDKKLQELNNEIFGD